MLAIKVNNEFIDLPADVSLELERNNPFLSDDDIQGEFSLALTIRYTEKNFRLLQYTGNFYKGNQKYTVDAEIYDAGMFRYAGKLVITQHQSNMNNIEETVWTGFFTIGSASFLQSIQEVLLSDLDLGGLRTFPWTGANATDGSGGFWQHYHAARIPNAFPYVFFTIYNEGWALDEHCLWMNKVDDSNNFEVPVTNDQLDNSKGNAISAVPSIYLSFLLQKIFENFGWKITGEITEDAGYKKIVIPAFKAIEWTNYKRTILGKYQFDPFPSVSFDLADFVPQQISVGSFLVSLKNRFGWWFDFDSNTKIATLRGYKSIIDGQVKDWSKFVQSQYTSSYADPDKIFSLVNNIDPSDDYPVTKNVIDYTPVATTTDLPTPADTLDGTIYLVYNENNFYVCEYDTDTSAYAWHFYANNIGDYTPTNADSTIESDISTMPNDFMGTRLLVPRCNQPGNYYKSNTSSDWAIRFLFYHGMQPDINGLNYPYASAINRSLSGTLPGDWTIPFEHKLNGVDDGSFMKWWQTWLKVLSIQEVRTFTLALPVTELRKFSFSDIIFINNVFFVVQSAKETLPYQDLIEMKMKRIY